jgi:hypothetical protein
MAKTAELEKPRGRKLEKPTSARKGANAQEQDPEGQLAGFIAKFTPEVAAQAEEILGKMRKLYPTALELVYDNYNALAIGFGPTERASDAVFSIAVYPRWVSLFFLQANGLSDPDKLLKGSGSVAKHIVLATPDLLNDTKVRTLMKDAEERAKMPFDARGRHRLIIKSISGKQRPRRPSDEKKVRSAEK